MSRKKARSGTWIERDLLRARAFWALSGTAKGLLFLFLLKRDMTKQHVCLNCRNITLTYKELENLHGEGLNGKPSGISRGSIARGIKELMAKGFIEIVRQGGAYQQDKTIYGLTNEWKLWVPGMVVREKAPGKKSGYHALQKNPTTTTGTIHTTITGP